MNSLFPQSSYLQPCDLCAGCKRPVTVAFSTGTRYVIQLLMHYSVDCLGNC